MRGPRARKGACAARGSILAPRPARSHPSRVKGTPRGSPRAGEGRGILLRCRARHQGHCVVPTSAIDSRVAPGGGYPSRDQVGRWMPDVGTTRASNSGVGGEGGYRPRDQGGRRGGRSVPLARPSRGLGAGGRYLSPGRVGSWSPRWGPSARPRRTSVTEVVNARGRRSGVWGRGRARHLRARCFGLPKLGERTGLPSGADARWAGWFGSKVRGLREFGRMAARLVPRSAPAPK